MLTGSKGPVGPKADNTYRNVALNPNDVAGKAVTYPHASSNSEYNLKQFAARNAIDGKTANKGHGAQHPSWGPHKRKDLWWKVEFGKKVEVDKIVLTIRADFPHDRHWHSATVEFSDGSREKINIKKMVEAQTYTFKKRTVEWLRFTELVQAEPMGWCGFSEVAVWGRDAAK
ncbi:discoidin domain-containing protein [bacterium]|nr:discoidin domain-containing protein [bacterium]